MLISSLFLLQGKDHLSPLSEDSGSTLSISIFMTAFPLGEIGAKSLLLPSLTTWFSLPVTICERGL